MNSTLVFTTSTEQVHRDRVAAERRRVHAARVNRMICAADEAADRAQFRTESGYCTACGSVEVSLDRVSSRTTDGTPSGYGCEVCG